jgi:hypothetical protein
MPDDSLPIVQCMVEYIYTGNYDDVSGTPGFQCLGDPSPQCINARVFALADKYQMEGLQALSIGKYSHALEETRDVGLFFRTLPDVFALTPQNVGGLRDVAIQFARKHLARGLQEPRVKAMYDDLVVEIPEFPRDLLSSFLQNRVIGNCSSCGSNRPMSIMRCKCKNCGKANVFP